MGGGGAVGSLVPGTGPTCMTWSSSDVPGELSHLPQPHLRACLLEGLSGEQLSHLHSLEDSSGQRSGRAGPCGRLGLWGLFLQPLP